MTGWMLIINILLSAIALGWGIAEAGLPTWSLWLAILDTIWLIALWRRITWSSSIGLLLSVLFAAIGILLNASPGWMLAGSMFALLAWDLTEFRRRLSLAYFEDDLPGLEKRHLLRLALLTLAGLSLASIPLFTSLRFSFEWILLLAVVIALGLTQLVRWLRGRE